MRRWEKGDMTLTTNESTVKHRYHFLATFIILRFTQQESDEEVIAKRSPSRFHLDRLCFSHGQEVVDFIRVLGKKSHRFGQFHAHYKKSGEGIEGFSCYLDVIAYLDLPVHTPQFFQENSALVGSYHEVRGAIVVRVSSLWQLAPDPLIGYFSQ